MSITTNQPATTVQMPLMTATGNIAIEMLLLPVLSPASVAANTTVEQMFSVPGLLPGDFVEVNKPALQAGLGIVNTRSGLNVLYIGFANNTAAPILPNVSESYQVCISRPYAISLANGLPTSLPTP